MVLNSSIINGEHKEPKLQPLSWIASIAFLVIIAALYYLAYQLLIPAYIGHTGQPYLIAYLWIWTGMMGTVFAISIVLYILEGHPLIWKTFASRYRLANMPGKDWLWMLVVLIVTVGFYFGLHQTAVWLGAFPVFGPPPLAPTELRPEAMGNVTPGIFFSMPVRGQWWVVIVYFIGWIFNILGEEFLYRGWLLPRQELAFGKYACLINGTIFTFQHWMQPFNFLAIWPGALFVAWVVQHRKNTWIGILQHGLMNFSVFVVLVRWVIG